MHISSRSLSIRRPLRASALLALLLLLGLVGLRPPPVALAACGVVTSVANATQLNAAITEFNSISVDCDYIIELTAEIDLTASTTTIDNDTPDVTLTIEGNGFAIDGQLARRTRPLNVAADTVVALQNIIITRGYGSIEGGGIHNNGRLTITDSAIHDNTASADILVVGGGGIWNSGSLSLFRSTVSGNNVEADGILAVGGGIYNQGSLLIRDSSIIGNGTVSNFVAYGGGIYSVEGHGVGLKIINSTISGNSASSLYDNNAFVGGLYVRTRSNYGSAPVTLIHTTVTDNSVTHQGVTHGSGAIFQADDTAHTLILTVHNSILAGNNNSDGTPGEDCLFWGTSSNHQLTSRNSLYGNSGANACDLTATGATPDADGNLVGVDPKLGPLANNGGPTWTHMPANDSPAVDEGDDDLAVDEGGDPLPADQRGYLFRVMNGTVDMGAVEVGAIPCPTFPVTAGDEDALAASITCFNTFTEPGDYTITLSADIDLTASIPTINNDTPGISLSIDGGGFTLDGDDVAETFIIGNTPQVTIADITIANSDYTGIDADLTNLTLRNVTIRDSTIYAIDFGIGDLVIHNSTLSGSGRSAIYTWNQTNNQTTVALFNTTLAGNGIEDDPAILADGLNDLQLTHVTIVGNRAGLGVYAVDNVVVNNSILAGNVSDPPQNKANDCEDISHMSTITISHSLVQVDDATYPCGAAADSSNITGQDPQLLPLGNHGGRTPTAPPAPGSPVVDKGDNDLAVDENGDDLTTDQRGGARRVGARVDMGAAELSTAFFMSAATSGNAPGVGPFNNADILKWDGSTWSKFFDAAAAGLAPNNKSKHNVNAFWIPDPDFPHVVMAFAQNGRKVGTLPGKVDGMDLVWWDGTDFSLWFDGSDVGLEKKTPEKIDGLHVLPGYAAPDLFSWENCLYYLLVSTQGPGVVPNYLGGPLKFSGEDVLGFCATQLGPTTAGHWHMVLDGSAEYVKKNAIDSISLSADGSTLYVTTKANFVADSAIGGHSSVYAYDLATELGGGDGEFSGPLFQAGPNGLTRKVDGLQMN